MEWINSIRSPNLTIFFQYITWLGYKDFLFLFVPFCYWFFDRKVFGIFTLFVFIGAFINTYLKDFFQDPRPDTLLNIDPWSSTIDLSYGFPSGHAQLAIVIWGYLFLNTQNIFLKIFCVFLIITISFSRIYLGVHDVADVVGGIIIGLFLIYALTILLSSKGEWLKNQSNWKHFLTYFTLILLFYLVWPIEESKIVALAQGSLIIGFWLGQKIDDEYFSFKSPEKLLLKIMSAIIALVGFIQINKFLEQILEVLQLNHNIEAIVSSLILGLYISIIAPFVLSMIKLQVKRKNLN